MAKVIDISELISLVCDKLIEYGVQPHTVWSDYSYNYRPILHFFQEHGCSHYDEGLLLQYRQEQQERYEREDLLRKNYLTEPLPAKAGRFGVLLKQPKAVSPVNFSFTPIRLSYLKVIGFCFLLQILIFDILLDNFIRHIPAACHKVSPCP